MLCDPDEKTPLCNNDIFQNAVRGAHRRMNSEQARALRDTAAKSGVWSSTIHLADDNVFSEAFFVNAVVVTKRVDTDIVYVDDTACVNAFMLPVVVMLARDASNNTYSIAWGILQDRTVEAFEGFFRFVARFFPLKTFMCDRCHAQALALRRVFGADATILNCTVHVGRNIMRNAGKRSEILTLFWAMRQRRTKEAGGVHCNTPKTPRLQALQLHDIPAQLARRLRPIKDRPGAKTPNVPVSSAFEGR